ncbi:MAG: CYTH domain-containing protein [Lachnospiraceae bacterium]|nr:CYTH domain-containing protein [Lachnospiraceae bacterium]
MEIERKYLIDKHKLIPDINSYPHHLIEQGYMCTEPVVRIRKSDDEYYLTYKSKGLMSREEYNLPLTKESYYHMLSKCDGNIISKVRYMIPFKKYTIELDIFSGKFEGLILAEVEFDNLEEAESFIPPEWFGEDVTFSTQYHNSTMSKAN